MKHIAIYLLPLAYGLGAARLILWILSYLRERLPADKLLRNVSTVLVWGVGGGSLYGALRAIKLSGPLGIAEADAVAALSYLGGFGVGLLLIDKWSRNSLIWEIQDFLSRTELDAILLVSRYGLNPQEAAKRLGMTDADFEEIFMAALLKIERRGRRLLESIRRAADKPEALPKKNKGRRRSAGNEPEPRSPS